MPRHILITGGAGFIGSHLADALLSRGETVTVLDIKGPEERLHVNPAARVIQADLTTPEAIEAVRALRPDIICHLAASANVAKSVAEPIMDGRINYLATAELLEAASRLGVRKFLFASTGGCLSSERVALPTPEHAAAPPLSPYAMHKLASERLGEFYRRERALDFVALRFANVYGPRQSPTFGESNVVATFAHRLTRGEPTAVTGDGRQTRDYVYIDDVVEACLRALEAEGLEGPLNVGSGRETDVLTLHRLIAEAAGSSAQPTPRPAAAGEPRRSCLDVRLIERRLGWKPMMPLEDGIKKTVAWHLAEATVPARA